MLQALALLFFAWEIVAVVRWVRHSDGLAGAFNHFWRTLHSDWMTLIVVSDHLFIAGTVLILLWLDATALGWRMARRIGLAMAFVALGTPALFFYLAWRLSPARGNLSFGLDSPHVR
jgi:hypothetical protein